jgi:hypothetical protein
MSTNQGIGSLVVLDNQDDRREVFYLFSQLSLAERNSYLNFCIRTINEGIKLTHEPPWVLLTAWSDTGELNESYFDLMGAISMYNLPIPFVLKSLEMYVRKLQKIPTESQRLQLAIEYAKLPELGVKRILEG